ncbi:MAG: hypothetical protein ACI8SE_001800 [Bacteroidia bacterium]|jgi:hypothetical protein
MKSSQVKKLVVLIIFVVVLATSAYYMYTILVKPSPYYPKEIQEDAE